MLPLSPEPQTMDKAYLDESYGKNKYKLHYIYREFALDFFRMDLNSLPKNAFSLKPTKHNAHLISLCLTLHVNLPFCLRKTSHTMHDLYGIKISHQQMPNYDGTAAVVIKPFVESYDYKASNSLISSETYIKIRGLKAYVCFIIDAVSRSIFGYQISMDRTVDSCILAMRKTFRHFTKFPENFRFIADGYSTYVLVVMQFLQEYSEDFFSRLPRSSIWTNNDEVTTEFHLL